MNERGMFLEVDLEYPKEIHRHHEDFPMAPERYNVTYDELSPLNQTLYRKMKANDFFYQLFRRKIDTNISQSKKYILHIKCLMD